MEQIYESKENIIPLKQGRKIAALVATLTPDQLDQQCKAYQRKMEDPLNNDSNDPLEIYHSYLKWIKEHYPSGHKSVPKLLESTIRKFKKDERYINDPRYLYFWLLTSKKSQCPIELFKYLAANGIGLKLAAYYEEYADLLEEMGQKQEADEVFLLGIQRAAIPLDRLKRKYLEFQKRLTIFRPPVEYNAISDKRCALATTFSSSESHSGSTSPQPNEPKPAKFNVFQEDHEDSRIEDSPVWNNFYGSESLKRKENTVKISTWQETTIPQQKTSKAVISKLIVFSDDVAHQTTKAPKIPKPAKLAQKLAFDESIDEHNGDFFSFEEIRAINYPAHVPCKNSPQKRSTKRPVSPTINTKAAMHDVFEMFNAPLLCEFGYDNNEEETISSKLYRPLTKSGKIGVFKDDCTQHSESEAAVALSTSDPHVLDSKRKDLSIFRDADDGAKLPETCEKQFDFFDSRGDVFSATPPLFSVFTDSKISPIKNYAAGAADSNSEHMTSNVINMNPKAKQELNHQSLPLKLEQFDVFRNSPVPVAGFKFAETETSQALADLLGFSECSDQVLPIREDTRESATKSILTHETPLSKRPDAECTSFISSTDDNDASLTEFKRNIFADHDRITPISRKDHNISRNVLPRHFDLMTPIMELYNQGSLSQSCKTDSSSLGSAEFRLHLKGELDYTNHSLGSIQSYGNSFEELLNNNDENIDALQLATKALDISEAEPEAISSCSSESDESEAEAAEDIMEFPNPCNPHEHDIRSQIMSEAQQIYGVPKNIYFSKDTKVGKDIENAIKSVQKGKAFPSKESVSRLGVHIYLDDIGRLHLLEKLGEGSFANVYLVQSMVNEYSFDDGDEELDGLDSNKSTQIKQFAMKIHRESDLWEFYILTKLRQQLSSRQDILRSIVQPYSCHLLDGESCLCLSYGKHGTLLDIVNNSVTRGYCSPGQKGIDEILVALFAVEIIECMLAVHRAGIIHGDVKIDNFLVRLDTYDKSLISTYKSDGWENVGIEIIDWGMSVDTNAFPADQQFKCNKKCDQSIDCWEARNDKDWTFEIDWYGVASIIHVMLFGVYMTATEEPFDEEEIVCSYGGRINASILDLKDRPKVKIASTLKRYWSNDMWRRFFDLMLNAGLYNKGAASNCIDDKTFPLRGEIQLMKVEIEEWLQSVTKEGRNLRTLILKMRK